MNCHHQRATPFQLLSHLVRWSFTPFKKKKIDNFNFSFRSSLHHDSLEENILSWYFSFFSSHPQIFLTISATLNQYTSAVTRQDFRSLTAATEGRKAQAAVSAPHSFRHKLLVSVQHINAYLHLWGWRRGGIASQRSKLAVC